MLTKATKILSNIKKVTILLDREITNLKLTAVVVLGPESSVNWYPTLSLKVPVRGKLLKNLGLISSFLTKFLLIEFRKILETKLVGI